MQTQLAVAREADVPLPGKRLAVSNTGKGRSVFADELIQPGEIVLEFLGELFTREQYIECLEPHNNHFLQIDEDLFLGPSRTPDNYINHSCSPNCGLMFQHQRIYLSAIREIKRGHELTFDYSTSMDEDHWEMDCICGEDACRGRVRDFRHLPSTVQRKYIEMGIIPHFILRKLRK